MIPGLRRLYDWVLHWAKTPVAEQALFFIAFIESSVFPTPPDVLLMAMVLSQRERWLRFASVCLIGSLVGGLAGYAIGFGVWEAVDQWFFRYVFSEATFEKVRVLYARYDFWMVFTAALTPIPYKVFTITAGVCHIDLIPFFVASLLGRGGRFFAVAALLQHFGPPIRSFIDQYFNWLTYAFVAALLAGFLAIKYIF